MILKKTDEYSFVIGGAHKALLKNNTEDQYEVWLGCEPGMSDIIWCRWKKPAWLSFDHVASDAEVQEFHTF